MSTRVKMSRIVEIHPSCEKNGKRRFHTINKFIKEKKGYKFDIPDVLAQKCFCGKAIGSHGYQIMINSMFDCYINSLNMEFDPVKYKVECQTPGIKYNLKNVMKNHQMYNEFSARLKITVFQKTFI